MFLVKYKGCFGFIKPWTAVRDSLTFSQQFLTPAIIMGIEKKLFPELLPEKEIKKIIRHRLNYSSINQQQEQTQTRGVKLSRDKIPLPREKSILKRGVLINPVLYLAFGNKEDSLIASSQHICLCRNEDILLPDEVVLELTENEFAELDGFELHFETGEKSFLVGYNRFNGNEPMYGRLEVYGVPCNFENIK